MKQFILSTAFAFLLTSSALAHFCGHVSNQTFYRVDSGRASGFGEAYAYSSTGICNNGVVRIHTEYTNTHNTKGLHFCVATFIYTSNKLTFVLNQRVGLNGRFGLGDQTAEKLMLEQKLTPNQAGSSITVHKEYYRCPGAGPLETIRELCREHDCAAAGAAVFGQ